MSTFTVDNANGKKTEVEENSIQVIKELEKIQNLAKMVIEIAGGDMSKFNNTASFERKLLEDEQYQDLKFDEKIKRFEIDMIVDALIKTGGKQTNAAKLLGIKLTTLNSKIKRYNIPVGRAAVIPIKNFIASSEK